MEIKRVSLFCISFLTFNLFFDFEAPQEFEMFIYFKIEVKCYGIVAI